MAKLLDEIHPGEILLEDFMKPMGISARQLAADIDVSPSRISELVNGQRPITADTALRLGLFFGMEPRFWLNLQSEYDIRVADRELRAKLSPRIRVFQPAAWRDGPRLKAFPTVWRGTEHCQWVGRGSSGVSPEMTVKNPAEKCYATST